MRERLSAERWRALIPHLDYVLDLEPDERQPWLSSLRQKDATLADDLQALVQRHEAIEEGFLAEGPDMPVPVSLAGQAAGAYVLRSQLGQGGMGSVWLAERSDGRYQGTAAVKVLNAALAGRAGEARFRREASILARLRHPHIAQLIDAGVSSLGQPYLVLERVDGDRIDRYCDAHNLPVDARVRLFLDVLAAVAHAHANLIVHRDIKPSNVLVAADGRVKLLDFGVAKLLERDDTGELTVLTREGESALTPGYAAPEQLTGGDITTATDVYALGVLLYLLLTGHHPAGPQSSSPADLVRAIVDTEPARVSDVVGSEDRSEPPSPLERAARRGSTPGKLRSTLRGDLDNIVGKALKKRPPERYASAEAMADDLRRYLDRQPVRARPNSLAYRARKFVVRNRVVLGAATLAAAALTTSAAMWVWQARTAARERDRALVELNRAEATNDLTSFLLTEATPSAGRPITNAELLASGESLVERRFAGDPTMRVHMLLTLSDRYHENQQFDRWQAALARAFAASRAIADVGLRSRAACMKALSLAEDRRHPDADALLAAALADLAALPDAASDEAYCRVIEATIANQVGDGGRAVAAAERAVALEEGRSGPAGRGFEALFVLATAYMVAHRYGPADRTYLRLLQVLDRDGLGETRTAAEVLGNWSAMLQNAGQHSRAVPLSERAVRVARARDSEHGPGPNLVSGYANALCAVGRCAEAIAFFEEALARARASGSPRRLFIVLGAASAGYSEVGDLGRAQEALRQAERLLQAESPPNPRRQAMLDRRLARLALARGDAAQALTLARRAAGREDDALRDPHDTMTLMLALAEASNASGEFQGARTSAERALSIAETKMADMQHSSFAGRAHLELGAALAGLGSTAAAREELTKALDDLRASLGPDAPSTRRALAQRERLGPS